jgi:hypothetical protein
MTRELFCVFLYGFDSNAVSQDVGGLTELSWPSGSVIMQRTWSSVGCVCVYAWEFNRATLFLGDINTGTNPSDWWSVEYETIKYSYESRGTRTWE